MPYYRNNKNLHDSVVIRLGRKLKVMYRYPTELFLPRIVIKKFSL